MTERRRFRGTALTGWWLAFLLPAAFACKSGSGARETSAVPVAVPAAEAAVVVAPAVDAAAPAVDAAAAPVDVAEQAADVAAPLEGPTDATEADAARGTVTIRFRNEKGAPRFVTYARWWTEAFKLERLDGASWKEVSWDSPMPIEPCPTDGSAPTCRPFLPPTPQPTYLRVRDLLNFEWSGTAYEYVFVPDESCSCYRRYTAPAGRYRATLCTHERIGCDNPPCPTEGPGEMFGYAEGEPQCASVEFELSGADTTVDLEVGGTPDSPLPAQDS
jgi:hypothetical protein